MAWNLKDLEGRPMEDGHKLSSTLLQNLVASLLQYFADVTAAKGTVLILLIVRGHP